MSDNTVDGIFANIETVISEVRTTMSGVGEVIEEIEQRDKQYRFLIQNLAHIIVVYRTQVPGPIPGLNVESFLQLPIESQREEHIRALHVKVDTLEETNEKLKTRIAELEGQK